MNRREAMLGVAALAGAAVAANARADAHEHHHGLMGGALAQAAADCIQKGQACLDHCLELLGKGETEMAGCAKSVNQMLALCSAVQQLANQNSRHLPGLAALAMKACKECEDECQKHADKHEACKACGESCAACYQECNKVAA